MMNGLQHTGAFVIKFHADTAMYAGRCEGRVEHVATGQTMHFYMLVDLLAFLDRMMKATHAPEQPEQL